MSSDNEIVAVLRQALEALENNRRTHHYCEDSWYSCPKHEEGCTNDSEGTECNCGADEANVEIDAAVTSIRQAIDAASQLPEAKKHEVSQEPVGYVGWGGDVEWYGERPYAETPLYTHPYTRQPKQEPPPECQTEAEKTAFAFGWWKAMEELKRNKNND